jgi:hypothetical protein
LGNFGTRLQKMFVSPAVYRLRSSVSTLEQYKLILFV